MPARPRPAAALFALALAVAACDEVPTTTVVRQVEDPWQFARGAVSGGAMPVVIEGRAFEADPAAVAGVVTQALATGVTRTATARFVAAAEDARGDGIRVVVTFNAPGGLGGRAQCEGGSSGGTPQPAGALSAVASLCDGPTLLVTVRGRLGESDGLDDPRVAALFRQIALEMFASPEGS